MTEEAKKNLLDYMLGKMPNESGVNVPQFSDVSEITNNLQQFTDENISTNFSASDYLQNSNGDTYLLYGNYTITDNDITKYYGAIVILDNKFQPLQAITKYSSGTLFNKFEMLKFNEDGALYGVDNSQTFNDTTLETTNTYRFIMLNNVLSSGLISDEYSVTLQASYYFPTEYNTMNFGYYADRPYRMYKKNGQASYVFIGDYQNNLGIVTLNVNVGSENEWNIYTASTGGANIYIGSYINWSDEIYLKVYLYYTGQYKEVLLQGETINISRQINVSENLGIFSVLNEDNVYVSAFSNSNNEYTQKIYKISSTSNNFITVYEETGQKEDVLNNVIAFKITNGNVFVKIANYKYYSTSDLGTDTRAGIIIDSNIYLTEIGRIDTVVTAELGLLFVKNEFNLYTISVQNGNEVKNVSIIYNSSNYNGEPFTNTNSLNSNSAVLYSDNSPVFARNLYNKTQNGATTTSTIEIPNSYLNDTLVDQKDLMSVNNNMIINDTNGFTKNVYETVYLNFVNTISVVNQNETQSVYNNAVATKLNTSINNPTDYDDLKLTKYRINYQDGTNTVSNLQATLQADGSYELLMTFFLSKLANTLELISEDEQTVYLTYNLANAEINKYYSFKQRVRIGGN